MLGLLCGDGSVAASVYLSLLLVLVLVLLTCCQIPCLMHFPFLHGLPGLSDFVSPCQDLELQEAQPDVGFCALESFFSGAMALGPRLHAWPVACCKTWVAVSTD